MTTTRQRLEAIDEVARTSGKSRDEVFQALWPTWKLESIEYQQLRAAMASTPAPRVTSIPIHEAREAADEHEAKTLANGAVADIAAFRHWNQLRATNPHAAALLMNRAGDAIQRGRAIENEQPPEPPPKQAA